LHRGKKGAKNELN